MLGEVTGVVELSGVVRVSGESNGHPQARQCSARIKSHREEVNTRTVNIHERHIAQSDTALKL